MDVRRRQGPNKGLDVHKVRSPERDDRVASQLSQPFPYSLILGTHDADVDSIANVIRKIVLINLKLRLQVNVRDTGKPLLKNYTPVHTI